MNALLIGMLLAQATVGVRISVTVARPTCVVVDAAGMLTTVPRASAAGRQDAACAVAPAGAPLKIEQRVEAAATATTPELRVIEFTALP